jgi:hypothetical protein
LADWNAKDDYALANQSIRGVLTGASADRLAPPRDAAPFIAAFLTTAVQAIATVAARPSTDVPKSVPFDRTASEPKKLCVA